MAYRKEPQVLRLSAAEVAEFSRNTRTVETGLTADVGALALSVLYLNGDTLVATQATRTTHLLTYKYRGIHPTGDVRRWYREAMLKGGC